MLRSGVLVAVGLFVACAVPPATPPDTADGLNCLTLPSVKATLTATSRVPVSVTVDPGTGAARLVHGVFPSVAPSALDAAGTFLSEQASTFRLAPGATNLTLATTRHGLVGTYFRFAQQFEGLPVFGHDVVVHVVETPGGFEIREVALGQSDEFALADVAPSLSPPGAIAAASFAVSLAGPVRLPSTAILGIAADGAPRLVWQVHLSPEHPFASWELLVDAHTGEVFARRDRLQTVDGVGLVFDPNPVATTDAGSLRDAPAFEDALAAARYEVVLPRLDGGGFLTGSWVDSAPSATLRAEEPTLTFKYERSDARFHQVMAYFHIDRAQDRLQALGFTSVNARQIVVNVDATREDNSYYDPEAKQITTGTGGVADAEDADVFVHEYGHAVQDDQVPGFGYGDQGGMGEGFGDYFAATMGALSGHRQRDPACIGEWDAVGIFLGHQRCLRRVDGQGHYPEALTGEVHDDGETWSGALWAARAKVGGDVMDRLIIESHFLLAGRTTMVDAAAAILSVDEDVFSGAHVAALRPLFVRQGLIRDLTAPADLDVVVASQGLDVQNPRRGGVYTDRLDDTQVVTRPGALAIRLHFKRIETETGRACPVAHACDNIYLTDSAGNLFQILNGKQDDVTSVAIPGDTILIRLVTDTALGKFGYQVDRVDELGSTLCGDGTRDPGEACDRGDLGAASCVMLGYARGSLTCRRTCSIDASGCFGSATCGNGWRDGPEACDGTDADDITCKSRGFTAGTIGCTADCRIDTALCNTCGNGKREGSEACDGADLAEQTCATVGAGVGLVSCTDACTLDTSACAPPVCR